MRQFTHIEAHTGNSLQIHGMPEEKLMQYDFYDQMNSTNTINHLEKLKVNIMKTVCWKRGRVHN
jgi:hypothetical protein